MFCRYCGAEVIHKIVFDDLLSEGLYKSSDLLTPSGGAVDGVFAVVVDLKQPAFTDKSIDVGPGLVALRGGVGRPWSFLEQSPQQRHRLDQTDHADHLAVLTTLPQTLELIIENLLSAEPIPAIVECSVEVQISTPETLTDFLGDEPQVFTSTDLGNLLLPEMESSSSQFLGEVVFSDLSYDTTLAGELSDRFREVITSVLDRVGVSICGLMSVNI